MNLDEKLMAALAAQEEERYTDAEKLYNAVLKDSPNNALALHNLGTIRFRFGDYKSASDLISQSIAANNNTFEAHSNLGLSLATQKRMNEALVSYKTAISLRPENPEIHNHLAVALMELGQLDAAVESCRTAISLKPDFALAHYNLGVVLQRQSNIGPAITAFKNAITFFENFPEAYCNLGLALMAQGKREEAVEAYQKAVSLRPNFPEALNNLGQPLNELGRLDEAAEAYRLAAHYRPTYADAFVNLAHTLRKSGKLGEAIQACRKALEVVPNNAKARVELISLSRQTCDWSNATADNEFLLATARDLEPFLLLPTPSTLAEQHFCARNWASRLPRGVPFSHARNRDSPRIRVGYLSCDFHMHATAFLMAELFERHDRSKFEIFGYGYDRDDGSDIRQRVIHGFDHFSDFYSVSATDAARKINDDHIDILVDLKGYTNATRTEIIVNRPAPIQVNYVGYPGTMGADFIDYVIADPTVAPMEHQPHYTEQIVHLPHCYQPNDTKRLIAETTISRRDCKLPEKGFVFCCFNAAFKIQPSFFAIWMRLLKAVPDSVLWLISAYSEVQPNLRREAQAHGVDPDRLIFASVITLPHHLARHKYADLFLDTLPYGAHTTASDALWAGLPVLTCMGDTFAGRVGSSALRAVGMPELITSSLEEYEARALDLALNPSKLDQIKQKLKQNIATTPMFDTAAYTKHLEAAYTHMWELWTSGRPPQPFSIEP